MSGGILSPLEIIFAPMTMVSSTSKKFSTSIFCSYICIGSCIRSCQTSNPTSSPPSEWCSNSALIVFSHAKTALTAKGWFLLSVGEVLIFLKLFSSFFTRYQSELQPIRISILTAPHMAHFKEGMH